MPRKSKPKAFHHGDLREALVAAGIAIVEKDGPAAFTLRECARRAGVSHAAPKNHFASAEDLIAEIAARGFEAFHAELATAADAAGPSADLRLIAMGRAYVAFAMAHPGVYGLMFRRPRADLAQSTRLKQTAQAAWMQLATAVAAVTGPDSKNIDVKAAQVWAQVHGIASLLLDKRLPPTVAVAALLDSSLSVLVAGLTTANRA